MDAPKVQCTGLAFGESPRWHDDRLWFCHWGTGDILAVDAAGQTEVVQHVETSIPFSIDWSADGRLLVVSGQEALLLTEDGHGGLTKFADLGAFGDTWNEIVVDPRGNIYVNGGHSAPEGAAAGPPGVIAVVTPDGRARLVADGIAFGNGMAVTPDGSTLIVAESHGNRLTAFDIGADGGLSDRRVWADLGTGFPDGICLDAEGAVWYADVPNRHCVRVRRGGEQIQVVDLDRGAFACMLGGADGRTLYIVAAEWHGMERMTDVDRTGQVLTVEAPAPHAGRP